MRTPVEYSFIHEKCGKELIVQLEETELNYDERDGYSERGYVGGIVDKQYRDCQCDFTETEDDKIVEIAIRSVEENVRIVDGEE